MARRRRRRQNAPKKVTTSNLPPLDKRSKPRLAIGRKRIFLFLFVAVGLLPVEWIIFNRIQSAPPGNDIPVMEEVLLADEWEMHDPYLSIPPTSGARTHTVVAPGTYMSPISNESQVAFLAEAGVIIQYSCDGRAEKCRAIVKKLESLVHDFDGQKLILAPGPAVADSQIAVSAWGKLLKLDAVDTEDIVEFVEAYIDNREQ